MWNNINTGSSKDCCNVKIWVLKKTRNWGISIHQKRVKKNAAVRENVMKEQNGYENKSCQKKTWRKSRRGTKKLSKKDGRAENVQKTELSEKRDRGAKQILKTELSEKLDGGAEYVRKRKLSEEKKNDEEQNGYKNPSRTLGI